MIHYPSLLKGTTIGVTAPSSGVKTDLHDLLKLSIRKMEGLGYSVNCGETIWMQDKAKSSIAKVRAAELNQLMKDENIGLIIPPWGGELLIEILEYLDFDQFQNKWILGYSDISTLLLAVTLKTGIATAHGTNLIDLRGELEDSTTAMWQTVLSTKVNQTITQYSSKKYQKEWDFLNPSPCVFHLTESTHWKVIGDTHKIQGRLLGGCIDVIRHLIGTPFGDVKHFQKTHLNNEPIIWYLENCELVTTDIRRSLVQMKYAGWFDHCSGILFGRSKVDQAVDNYTTEDVYKDLFEELQIPIIYDIDCGHVPPQITFINGAYAEVEVMDGKGTVKQTFKE